MRRGRRRHSMPLVDGTSVPSMRTASRSAARDRLERRLDDVVRVLAPHAHDVQRAHRRHGEPAPELLAQLRIERRVAEDLLAGERRRRSAGTAGPTGRARPRSSASSSGTATDANRRTPALSPSASRTTSPSRMPVSSTVWCASISRSPLASIARSNPRVLAQLRQHVVEERQTRSTRDCGRCRRGRGRWRSRSPSSSACASPCESCEDLLQRRQETIVFCAGCRS